MNGEAAQEETENRYSLLSKRNPINFQNKSDNANLSQRSNDIFIFKADGTDETDETNVCFDSNSSATSKSECKTTGTVA